MNSRDLFQQTSSIMTLSDHCIVSRRNGWLIIEIPEDKILSEVGTRDLPGRVLDGEMALNHVVETILHTKSILEEYETNLVHLVHSALESAIRNSAGVTY